MTEPFDLSALYDEFKDEARQQLDLLDRSLLHLEQHGELPGGQRSDLLRALHTLKGNSGMLGLRALSDAVHAVESRFRQASGEWPQPALDALFGAAAALRAASDRVGTPRQEESDRRLREATEALREGAPPGEGTPMRAADPHDDADRHDDAAPHGGADPREGMGPRDRAAGLDPSGLGNTGDLLRVPFHALDDLLATVGDLVGTHAALEELLRAAQPQLDAAGLKRPLTEEIEALDRIAERLRAQVLGLRLVPVGRVLARFPSLARDLAREQGKRVRVQLEGEETGLDKSTVDQLGEPLLHLVRNAVDHGIETPAERAAAGKPEEARIRIAAERRGDQVRLTVEDDGRGLDVGRIVESARAQGLLHGAEDPSEEALMDMIFRQGFSTRRSADTVSGRGIGLDVVRRRVTALRGSLEVERLPSGTRFRLSLPLRVAIVPAVLFQGEEEFFAVAAGEVQETIRLPRRRVLGGAELVRHRGESVPVVRPERLFGWMADAPAPEGDADETRFLIVLRRGDRRLAVPARHLLDPQDIVVKAVPRSLGRAPGISGITALPGGRVVLLLDPGGLLELNLHTQRRTG